jgi:ABC-2 type transport system permease protein
MHTWTIFRREIGQYFTAPYAYFVASAFLVFCGLLFAQNFQQAVQTGTSIYAAFVPSNIAFLMILFAPLLTMRVLAEEKREGTIELLLTAPVPEGAIVLGKFFGVWCYYTVLLGLTLVYQLVLLAYAPPDIGHTILAYLGVWLYGGAMLAVGMVFSALTENQILAAFLSVIVLLLLYLGDFAGDVIGNEAVAQIIRQLSLLGHFSTSFQAGVLRAEDVAFFAGIIVIMLYLSIRAVQAQRWQ